ncbi:Tim44 domain-containing protein [Acetobacter lambici]|uniref:Tim44-like domain-containing protein n=1 Tax=Acetobacter lambici TaxID=1332824 RepID=A0ABT1EXA7_9PROT|nr:Tim44-like domain-containing protein [Acetobacter lambici]MCP1257565.1 Tim44-like domain-containing protein [Acetobacter lambici]NHO55945.1 Tim44 domain-containing protein [Acetobacter lambici]
MKSRLLRSTLHALLAASLLAGPLTIQADARPGQGGSMGSRGSRTWSAPPVTRTTPYSTAPMDRSIAPRTNPSAPGYGAPQMGAPFARPMGYANRHPFLTGLAGGFLGAGLFGMLSGHGFMGGMHGFFSLLGLMVQIGLVVMFVMWLIRRFSRGNAGGNGFGMGAAPRGMPGAPPASAPPPAGGAPVQITPADYQSFQQTLMDIQSAWNQQNIPAMQQMATPEMVSYFNEQLATLASQGARNVVSDVRFLQGDLAEAWRENGMDYASVAMRYSLIDLTTNATGQVVDGSSTTPVTITEVWTFVRPSRGGRWLLSAIQQAR